MATLFVAHLTCVGKWHALSIGGGLVGPKSPGRVRLCLVALLLQSIALVILLPFTTRYPLPPKEVPDHIGDGKKMEVLVEVFWLR